MLTKPNRIGKHFITFIVVSWVSLINGWMAAEGVPDAFCWIIPFLVIVQGSLYAVALEHEWRRGVAAALGMMVLVFGLSVAVEVIRIRSTTSVTEALRMLVSN